MEGTLVSHQVVKIILMETRHFNKLLLFMFQVYLICFAAQ